MRLLIVEDDPSIQELLTESLTEDGFEVSCASSAAEGLELARLFPFALLILDVGLPEGLDAGFALGRLLRETGLTTPILYLTARTSIEDRVAGLEAGADDYLVKPFAHVELRARLQALLRRAGGFSHNLLELPFNWRLDLSEREVSLDGQVSPLTRREFGLLELLACNPGRVFERPEIIERLWADEAGVDQKVIDLYVSLVRRKTDERLIETMRGIGYRIARDKTSSDQTARDQPVRTQN